MYFDHKNDWTIDIERQPCYLDYLNIYFFKTLFLWSVYKTILRCNSIITWEIFSNDNTTDKGIPEKMVQKNVNQYLNGSLFLKKNPINV